MIKTGIHLFFKVKIKANIQTSTVVIAARADIKVKDSNNNYHIKIIRSGLSEAKRQETKNHVYVIWLKSDKHIIKILGQINSTSSLLSKILKATFETVTSIRPLKIFITAELEASVNIPARNVLSTNNF